MGLPDLCNHMRHVLRPAILSLSVEGCMYVHRKGTILHFSVLYFMAEKNDEEK